MILFSDSEKRVILEDGSIVLETLELNEVEVEILTPYGVVKNSSDYAIILVGEVFFYVVLKVDENEFLLFDRHDVRFRFDYSTSISITKDRESFVIDGDVEYVSVYRTFTTSNLENEILGLI
jgi:hypothetical protein